jgi:hypothetical protein
MGMAEKQDNKESLPRSHGDTGGPAQHLLLDYDQSLP